MKLDPSRLRELVIAGRRRVWPHLDQVCVTAINFSRDLTLTTGACVEVYESAGRDHSAGDHAPLHTGLCAVENRSSRRIADLDERLALADKGQSLPEPPAQDFAEMGRACVPAR